MKIKVNFSNKVFFRSLNVLEKKDKKKLLLATLLQSCLSILDLLGVALIGLLGLLSVTGLQGQTPAPRLTSTLDILRISTQSFQMQAIVIATVASSLLVGRTILSILITRKVLFFLTNRGAQISSMLVQRLLAQPLLFVLEKTTQQLLFSVTRGVEIIVLQVLASTSLLVSDVALLLVLAIGLLVIDPATAIGTILIFGLVGYGLHISMHSRAGKLGQKLSKLNIDSNEKIIEVLSSYRENIVRNRRNFYSNEIRTTRQELARTTAEINFMPFISKYVIESTIILGAVGISFTQFILQDVQHAVGTLAIFLAAGTRIAPSVLRVQQGIIQIRQGYSSASPTLELFQELSMANDISNDQDVTNFSHTGFSAQIIAEKVTLTYPRKSIPAIQDLTLKINEGEFVAIVGPSGAGKTTLTDVLLGVLEPDSGQVTISGKSPREVIENWPGAIAYVPQDVLIVNGTIRHNIALGYPENLATDENILPVVKLAQLEEFVSQSEFGLDSEVGERGSKLSGGQRQRLGIARALFTKPRLLVLDEATSSLDAGTEFEISNSINNLKGSTTVVLIAHRLSTVRNADLVIYMENGQIVATGTFEYVRASVPNFAKQAKLMGL